MTASTGGASAPRMNFYELHDQFFQLYAQESFTPAEGVLYFWWLNQFNSARWPASLPRKVKQIAAELNWDEKTVDKARHGLQRRGLLDYQAGTKTVSAVWFLNYQPVADYPRIDRKFSGQSAQDSPQINRKNSGRKEGNTADYPRIDRKFSGPIYKEEDKDSSKEDKDPLTGAGAGEAEENSPLANDPNTEAPSPRCAAPSSPAADELSDDEFGRYRAIPRDAAMVDAYLAQINHPKAGKGALFFDYYESRGWKHGQHSHRCENWKALVRGFGFRDTQPGTAAGQPLKSTSNFSPAAAQAKQPTR